MFTCVSARGSLCECMCLPVGADVMTGACVSISLMKSLVILSSSSTALMERGTPPPGMATGPGGEGYDGGAQHRVHIYTHNQEVLRTVFGKGYRKNIDVLHWVHQAFGVSMVKEMSLK